jgi:hypothetical protein
MAKRKKKEKPVELDTSSVKQRRFLKAFAQHGNITAAARVAGCDRASHRYWLENDPDYLEKFRTADEEACDVLRAEIFRRAAVGIDKPVFYKGARVATVKEYSDGLLMFLARARMPNEFRDRVDINQTGEQQVRVIVDENWYGNNAHDLIAEGAAAPNTAADE